MVTLRVNGTSRTVDVDPDTPLLWVLRDDLRLTGTKFGCGVAQCGACTVHINGQAARACVTPVGAVQGREVATIGGHPLGQIVEHMARDSLVGWAWSPGVGRKPAPGTQAAFGALIRAWADAGAVCPGG